MIEKAVKSKERQEIDRFLDLLERRLVELGRSTFLATSALDNDRLPFADYVYSRDLSSECWTFSIVIERRIDKYEGSERDTLIERFDTLTIGIWATLLTCSLRFLDVLARQEFLPLGSREIFIHEIKTLYDAYNLLESPRYAYRVDDVLRSKQRQAERILSEVIERAPALLDFGR
jgi:hypothetical protein